MNAATVSHRQDFGYTNFVAFEEYDNQVGQSDESRSLRKIYTKARSHQRKTFTAFGRIRTLQNALYELFETCSDDGWDGYDAVKIKEETYQKAYQFIRQLPPSLPIPEILPEATGEISFEWYKNPRLVFVTSIDDSGSINYAGLFGRVSKINGTEYFNHTIPSIIIESINKIERYAS